MRNKELKAYAKRKVMMLICIYLLVIRADASETLEPAVYEKQLLDAISKRKNEIELLENQLVVKGFKGPEPVAKEEKAAEKKKAQNHKDVSDSDPFYSSYSHGEEKSTDNKNAKTSPTRASSDSKRDAAMHAPSKSSNKQQMGKSSDSSYDSDESTTKAEKPENVHKQQNKEPKNASMQPSGKSEDVDQSDGKSSEKEPEQKKNEDLSAKKEKSKEDVRYASADGSEDDEDTLVSSHAQMKKNSTAQENDKEKSGQHKASESEAAQSPVQKSVMEPSRQSEAESKTDSDSLSETGNGTSSQTQPEPKAKKDDSAKTDHDAASQLRSEPSNGDDSSLKSDHETTSQSQSEPKTNDSPKAKDEERKSEPEPKQEMNESPKSDHETANQPESRKPESEPKSKEETNDLSKTEDKESKSESSQEANKTPESGSSSESNGSSKSEDKKGAQSDPVHESSAEPKPSDEQQGDQTEKKNGTEPTNHRENSTAQGGPAKSIQENEKVPSNDAQTEQNKQPGDKKTEQDAVLEDEHKSTDKEPTASSETESKSDEDKKSTPAINAEPEEKAKENEKTDAQSKEKDEAQEADKQTDAAASGQSPGDSKLRLVNSLECVSFSKIHIWGLTLDEEMKMKMDIKDLQPVKSSENVDIANFLLKHNQHLFTDKMDAISDSLFTECASRVVSLTIDLETYSEKDLLASYNWSVFKNLKGFEIRGKGIAEHPDADGPIVNVLSEIEKIFSSDSRKDAQNTLVLSHMRISNFADSLKKLNKVDLVFHEASYLFSLMDKTIDVFVSEISANISTLTLSRFVIEDGTDLVDDHAHIATIKTITVENCSEGMINRLLQHCFFRAARTHVLRNNDLQNLKQYGLTPFLYLESLVLIGEKAFTRLAVEEISGLPTLNYIAVFGENKDLTVDAEIFDREKTRIRSFGISTGCNLSINGKIKEEWLEGTLLREYLWKDERANCIFEIDIGEKPKQTTMTILSPSKYLGYPDKLSLGPILSSLDKSSSLPVQMYTVSESTVAGENEENGNEKVQEKTENLFKSLGITVAPSFV